MPRIWALHRFLLIECPQMGVSRMFCGKSTPVLLSVAVCEGATSMCVFHVYYIIDML